MQNEYTCAVFKNIFVIIIFCFLNMFSYFPPVDIWPIVLYISNSI